jgi:putative transposase
MVAHPADYRWSSYRANAEGLRDPLLTPHEEYRRLGASEDERRAHYRLLFKTRLDSQTVTEIREATNGNYALGNERFREEIAQTLRRRASRGKSGRPARNSGR